MTDELKGACRPEFPRRAVITAGMPYGNKELHFGHVGGVFVHADAFARFLRDRIGEENVIFVSGTDCYGSPILEGYRKAVEEGRFEGTISEYVQKNHEKQRKSLEEYEISLNLFGASALGDAGEMHREVSREFFQKLYENGSLTKDSTPQFYDPEFHVFLNGRQVVGHCPIQGCSSEHGYADECSLGHQYMPSELIDPKSTLSGKTPEVRSVTNWYFRLPDYLEALEKLLAQWRENPALRPYMLNAIEEFLKKPVIYVQKKLIEDMAALRAALPAHELVDEENKSSVTFVFENLETRDEAREILNRRGLRFRTGKTLVPFRLSGNTPWGVPVPDTEDLKDLTFWVWPESLWAPISFTRSYLKSEGRGEDEWENWWKAKDCRVYQFIGEDNVYFYGIAEMGMFLSYYADKKADAFRWEGVNLPELVANKHILFMDKKASSSGAVKPPMAQELLDFYTPEQLRIHFLGLGLASKNARFQPQVYQPPEKRQGVDPVLKEGNLLTNVFNRLVRSCFYTAQNYFEGRLPAGKPAQEIVELSNQAILEYERHMANHDFHRVVAVLDQYLRTMSKHWANNMRRADAEEDQELRRQILLDCFHGVRVGMSLVHPVAPSGCEMIREYLNLPKSVWSWDHIFEPLSVLCGPDHQLKNLAPRVDFFRKHERQFEA